MSEGQDLLLFLICGLLFCGFLFCGLLLCRTQWQLGCELTLAKAFGGAEILLRIVETLDFSCVKMLRDLRHGSEYFGQSEAFPCAFARSFLKQAMGLVPAECLAEEDHGVFGED